MIQWRPSARFPHFAIALLASILVIPTISAQERSLEKARENLATFDQVWTTIRDRHYDPSLGGLDWDAVRAELRPKMALARTKNEARSILRDMISRLKQSHLQILPGEMYGDALAAKEPTPPCKQVWDSGFGFEVRVDGGDPVIASIKSSSDAARAGIRKDWKIQRIGDHDLLGKCEYTGDVNRRLLIQEGESIDVEFLGPDGQTVVIYLPLNERRQRVYQFGGMPTISVWIEHERLEGNIGYIAFNWFFDPMLVMGRFNQAMRSFMDTDGLIIDVRGNRGGMGSMATAMMAWFVEEEGRSLGTLIARDCKLEEYLHPRSENYPGKVAVLIDGGVGSAAETFAEGMRDSCGARLFGEKTMGAVLPAAFDPLPNGDFFQFVIADYVTAEGRALEGAGVVPDQKTNTVRTAIRDDDPAIRAAVAWIQEAPAKEALAVLDRFVQVTGGLEAYTRFSTRISRGTMLRSSMDDLSLLTLYETTTTDRLMRARSEALGEIVDGSQGDTAWTYSLMTGPILKKGGELAHALYTAPIDAPARWQEMFEEIDYIGKDDLAGRACHIVKVKPKRNEPEIRYYEVSSGLLNRVETTFYLEGNRVPGVITYADYKEVDGILIPHLIQWKLASIENITFTIQEIDHHKSIPPCMFDPPPSVAALLLRR